MAPVVIVTAVTESYFPGVVALANSLINSPGAELHCFCFGDQSLVDSVKALGIHAHPAPEWDVNYPTSENWPEAVPASYFRLMIPRLFADEERVVWVDADCIVVDSLEPLAQMEFSQPVAAVYIPNDRYKLGFQVRGLPAELASIQCTFNGLLVFNIAEWNWQDITRQCEAVMNSETDLVFRYIDQSVLSYVLRGNFHHLAPEWQVFAGRKTKIPHQAKILHWVGAGLPWRDEVNNQATWNQYAAAT